MTDATWHITGGTPGTSAVAMPDDDAETTPGSLPTASPAWAYFLDFDGTLVDLAALPDGVRVDDTLRATIHNLWRATDGAVAVVSGRSIAAIDAFLRLPDVPIAGQHGAERRGADGVRRRMVSAPAALEVAREQLRALVVRHPSLLLEDKGLSLAVHYRQAPQLAGFAHRSVRALARRLGAAYAVQGGKRVVELKPAAVHKGMAVEAFMDESPFDGRRPVFVGDDLTDEDGFAAVNAMGGVSVKIGGGRTVAHWTLANVRALRAWLDHHTTGATTGAHAPLHTGATR